MHVNEYVLECHARYVLEDARAIAARAALVRSLAPEARPLTALATAARALYARATRAYRGHTASPPRADRASAANVGQARI